MCERLLHTFGLLFWGHALSYYRYHRLVTANVMWCDWVAFFFAIVSCSWVVCISGNINQSLMVLRNCIESLRENQKNAANKVCCCLHAFVWVLISDVSLTAEALNIALCEWTLAFLSSQCSDSDNVGCRTEGHPACKKVDVTLLMVTIWLELCTSYSSGCYHPLHQL